MIVKSNEEESYWEVRITDGYDTNEQDLDTDEPITLNNPELGERSVILSELMENYTYEGEGGL